MGLTERLRNAFQALAGVEKTAGSQAAWGAVFSAGIDNWLTTIGGGTRLIHPYSQHPTVYAAVSAIAQGISALPIEMFPDSDTKQEKPVKDSLVKKLLDSPGPDMDGPQLIEGTIDYMELSGDAFWFMDGMARRTAGGPQFPTSLTLWDPKSVRAVVKGGAVTAWEYQSAQEVFTAPAESVIQFKFFNPYDSSQKFRGLAPLDAAMVAARGGYKAIAYQEAFFENSCIMGGLVTAKEGAIIQPEAMIRLRDELESRHMGAAKHGRLGVINAPVDYTELGTSQKDMGMETWLDAASAYILMVFKVPPSVAGLQKDANYNASVQQAKQFWYNHMPLAHYIERRIKKRLCEPFGIAETPYFKTESIKAMTEDQKSVSEMARNFWNMGVSFKDVNDRLELGYPADDVAADTRWVPFSMVNADDQAVAAPARDQVTGQPQSGSGQQNKPGDMPTQDQPGAGKMMTQDPSARETIRGMNWRQLISKVRPEESAFEARLRSHFFALRNEVLGKIARRKAMKAGGDITVDAVLFDEDKSAKDIKAKTESIYKDALQKGAETVIQELGLTIDFNFLSPEVQKFMQEKMFEIADLVDGPTQESLRATLQEGIRLGESVEKIAERVSHVFDVQMVRARRIARTEVAEAFNGGRFVSMKEAGVTQMEWLTARDDRVRDSHQQLDGEVAALGDRFSNGLLYPLDPAGPPEEIVNCRCVALPVA